MAVVGTTAKLAEDVVGRALHAVIHPVSTASYVVGVARGALAAVIGGHRDAPRDAEWVAPRPGERLAGMPDLPPPLPPQQRESAENFATEPKAPSKNAEHGGPGDDSIDDWQAELDEAPDLAVGEQPQRDTEPLMDPSLTKSVKSEADLMQKAADPEKD